MKLKHVRVGLILGLFFNLTPGMVLADQVYIKELDGLLNSLSSRDSSRVALSLRLADAYFDESLRLTTANMGTATPQARAFRRKAINLYEDSLSGFNGLFPKPSGDLRSKVQFQLARLYNDEGVSNKAQEIWKILVNSDTPQDIKRESVLRLAEVYEQKQDPSSLETAKKFYYQALSLCGGQDVCSYSHYRLAWVFKVQGKYAEALSEMTKALWDSKGQVREEALRDYMAFTVERPGDGHEALSTIEGLNTKLHRPNLELDLAKGFYAAGNRQAGTYVLENANKKNPTMRNYANLLEEYYGFRDWQKFRATLDDITSFFNKSLKTGDLAYKNDLEIEKILRRLTVQLDGERTSSPEHGEDFKNAVMFYLALYPEGPQRTKMIDGWLVAETNAEAKMAQLTKWIGEETAANRKKEELRLREILASEAQKASRFAVVAEQMNVISQNASDKAKKREYSYHRAYAFYQDKKYDQALPLFEELAKVGGLGAPDSWAIQSQHLALDILGQQKNYREVLSQANSWIKDPRFESWLIHDSKNAGDLKEMKKIAQNAAFQDAVTGGVTPTALDLFKEYCDRGIELPKSCENAQVLAYKLKNEPIFIAMLKKLGKKNELITELEVSGQFGEAAENLQGALNKNSTFKDYLKVALLYELGGDLRHRDEVLKNVISLAVKQKSFGEDEDLIYSTLKEANLINVSSLKFPWKKDNHLKLVSELEESGQGNAETRKILVASCENLGLAWEKTALAEIKRADVLQRQITFNGKSSKRKFEQRLAALKKLNSTADCYLQGATAKARVIMASLLAKSQYDMASEIKASPIPEGLDAQVVENLKKSLDQMAAPFNVKGKSFEDLAATQLEKVTDPGEKLSLKQKIAGGDLSSDLLSDSKPKSGQLFEKADSSKLETALSQLHQNPNERQPLEKLKSYYEAIGKPRLAAYFQGRLNQLQTSPQEAK